MRLRNIKQKMRFALVIIFLAVSVFSEDLKKSEEKFSIKVAYKKDYMTATLDVGDLQIKTGSKVGFFTLNKAGKEPFSFRTYHGNNEAGKNIVPGLYAYSLKKLIDKVDMKSVEMVSSLFKNKGVVHELRVRLTIQRGFPGVFIKSSVINLSDEKSNCYFCWLTPMPSNKYINSNGEHSPPARWKKVEFEDWIYLPGSGKKQGFAVMMDNFLPVIKIFTNQKEKGAKGSWGIMRGGLWFNKNEENKIDFVVVPANKVEEIKEDYKKIKEKKVFPEFKIENKG